MIMTDSPILPANPYLTAGFYRRLAAYLVDQLILIIPVTLLVTAFERLLPGNYKGLSKLFSVFLVTLYNVVLLNIYGRTAGKKVFGVKVLSLNGSRPSLSQILARETVGKWISGIFFALGYLTILTDKNNRGWHDKMAGTQAVRTGKDGQIIHGTLSKPNKFLTVVSFILFFGWGLPFLFSLTVLIYLFIASPNQVKGDAMSPTLKNNDYIMTYRLAYKNAHPSRGDIILFNSEKSVSSGPVYAPVQYIKRVIGLPGETIMFWNGRVYINNEILNEPYLPPATKTGVFPGSFLTEGKPYTIPEGTYFVLGDNRTRSSDSREFGVIKPGDIIGKYWFTYYHGGTILPQINKEFNL